MAARQRSNTTVLVRAFAPDLPPDWRSRLPARFGRLRVLLLCVVSSLTSAGWINTQTYEGHSHYVMYVAFNPKDANTFASASLDRTIKVWGIGTLQPHFTLEGHEKGVNWCAPCLAPLAWPLLLKHPPFAAYPLRHSYVGLPQAPPPHRPLPPLTLTPTPSHPHPHPHPLASHLSPLTSHLSPLTSHLSPAHLLHSPRPLRWRRSHCRH